MSENPLYLLVYFVVLLVVDAFYLSQHHLIFAGVTSIKNKAVKYFMTAFSVLLSFGLIFLPAVIYSYFFEESGFPKLLIYGLGGLAYILATGFVAHQNRKKLGR